MKVNLLTSSPLFFVGLLLIYWGIRYQMPGYVLRSAYERSGLAERRFSAFISADGFRVQGSQSEWKYGWPAVLVGDQSDNLVMLYTGIQIFIFPKRDMTQEQVVALQQWISALQFPGGMVPKY